MHFQLIKTLIFMSVTAICCQAYSDAIKTVDGESINGEIFTFENGLCIFKTQYMGTIKILNEQIIEIITDEVVEIDMRNGERLHGILSTEKKDTILTTPRGNVAISINEIVAIRRLIKDRTDQNNTTNTQIGKRVTSGPPLDFLNGSTVLLSEGVIQIDFGFDYRQNRDFYRLPSVGNFENHSYTARQIRLDATIRRGWPNGVETYLTIPGTYSYIEQVSSNEYVRNTDEWRLSDASAGIQIAIARESIEHPALSFSTSISAPTGEKRYYSQTDDWLEPLNNSSGHWTISTGLSTVRTTDPVIIFSGVNIIYSIKEKIDSYKIEPGAGIASYFGVGFGLNERFSWGTRFSYSYYENSTVDNKEIYGSGAEAMDITISSSYRPGALWIYTPQVTYSLNSDAGANSISLRMSRPI